MATGGVREGAAWSRTPLGLLEAYRITEIPRRPDAPAWESGRRDEADPGGPQRVAALVAAYHAGIARETAVAGAIAFGWVRTATSGPVQVLAAGAALTGSCAGGKDGDVLLSLPGGARGTVLPPGALAGLLGLLPSWREIAGISDGLLAPTDELRHRNRLARCATPSLDEGLLGSWTGPFGWMIIAKPLRPDELWALADEVARRQRLAEGAADRFPERAVEARRLKERHAELHRGTSTGFWRITVAAGGCDEASAARVAGLFCASIALDGLPYALSPAAGRGPGQAIAGEPGGDAVPGSPFCGSTELLAALARPPESEVPGVRLALRPDFDVTPEAPASAQASSGLPGSAPPDGADGIHLGDILDRNLMPAGAFLLPRDSL